MSVVAPYDVCDTSLIYSESGGYSYSLPQSVLDGFLSGKAFDHPVDYTPEELSKLKEDIRAIFADILSKDPVKEPLAVMTAGAPGAGKTILMRQELEGKNVAYICPDDVCLKRQTRTYQVDIESGDGSKEMRQVAYNKWRPGSNAATHLILANLIREKYEFYFGTTSTGPSTHCFLKFLKDHGYQIRLIHITAPDDVRWASIQKRDEIFIQTTEDDVRKKGLLLPQRIKDTYLAYADRIEFFYRDGVEKDAELAATWVRNGGDSGILEIISSPQYEQIKKIHNAATEVLGRADLRWEETVEKNSIL